MASPSLESLPSRIGATERQTVARVVDLGIVLAARSASRSSGGTAAAHARLAAPGRRILVAESIRPSRAVSFTYLRGQRLFGPTEGHGVIYVVRAGCVRLSKARWQIAARSVSVSAVLIPSFPRARARACQRRLGRGPRRHRRLLARTIVRSGPAYRITRSRRDHYRRVDAPSGRSAPAR